MASDSIRFMGEGVAISLECGHPNVVLGEWCPHCNKMTAAPENDVEKKDEQAV